MTCQAYSLVFYLLFISINVAYSQQPSGVIEVTGRIIERGISEEDITDDKQLYVVNYGPVPLQNGGLFEFKAPRDLDIKVEILPSEFKIMRPLDGLLKGETSSYQIDIYIIHGTEDSVLKNQIASLDEEIRLLQSAKSLSDHQIQKLDKTILDTVFHFQEKQKWFGREIKNLNLALEKSAAENQSLKDTLRLYQQQMKNLSDSVKVLIGQLAEALEEKYLRQKAHYDDFSQLLLQYETQLKDLRDQLPQLEYCFKRPEALKRFNDICISYGKARNALFDKHKEHLAGIKHHWPNLHTYNKAEALCHRIFSTIHDDLILPGVNQNINPHLKNYATKGIRKVKDVKRAGLDLKNELDPNIQSLDQEMDELFAELLKDL